MLLEMNIKNHFVAALSAILMSVGSILLLAFFNFNSGIVLICSMAFLFFVLPGIYLHIEYWFINKDEKYIIAQDSITQVKKGKEETYYSNDIKKIIVYGSATLFKTWFHLSAMEQYHFARIFLKNGETMVITCLLTPRVDKSLEILKDVDIKKRKGLFNSTYIYTE